jgi:hypothetical protein
VRTAEGDRLKRAASADCIVRTGQTVYGQILVPHHYGRIWFAAE